MKIQKLICFLKRIKILDLEEKMENEVSNRIADFKIDKSLVEDIENKCGTKKIFENKIKVLKRSENFIKIKRIQNNTSIALKYLN